MTDVKLQSIRDELTEARKQVDKTRVRSCVKVGLGWVRFRVRVKVRVKVRVRVRMGFICNSVW